MYEGSFVRQIVGICALFFVFTGLWAGDAYAAKKQYTNPNAGTAFHTLVEGLKLIKQGKFDEWIDKWCHKSDLCYNSNSIKSIKRYNLPTLKRLLNNSQSCLRGNDDTILVTRIDGDPSKDAKAKIFVECRPKGMPRPFHLKKENGVWKFTKI